MAKYGRAKKYDEKDGYWFSTENGTHIHVEEGQTPREAVNERFDNAKSYNGAKKRGNPNFDEKEYGEFFDERGVLKEGKEDEYFEKVERNKVNKLKDVIKELDNKGLLKTYDEDEIINAIYENELYSGLGDFEGYVGDAVGKYLEEEEGFEYDPDFMKRQKKDESESETEDESEPETSNDAQRYVNKTWEAPLKNREGWTRQENGRYDFGDDENYGSINNDGEVEGTVTATRVRNGDHDKPQVKYFENVEDAIEWVEEEPSTEESTPTKTTDNRISDARKRLKDAGLKDNLSDETIELILKTFGR